MNKIKVNVDRPIMSSKDISNKMNFEDILSNHKIMAKPFYKSTWFFGVTGLATIGLIAGSIYTLNQEGDELYKTNQITENVIPIKQSKVIALNSVINTEVNKIKKEPIEKTSTLKPEKKMAKTQNAKNIKPSVKIQESVKTQEVSKVKNESLNEIPKTFSFIDLHPRISGKLDGNITKKQLIDDEGLVTNTDVEIISFQLHVVSGMSSQVFNSKGHTLNSEMKLALEKVNVGEEVYFEKIKGQATTGEVFRLSPLRYVLLN